MTLLSMKRMLAVAFVGMVVGSFWMSRVVKVEV